MKQQHILLSLFIAASVVAHISSADAAAERQEQLRIHTGVPKKTGDLLFSYTTEWQKADADPFRVTSISFINNSKLTGDNPAAQVSKKLVTAFKDSMTQVDPGARGAVVSQKDQEPAFTLSNRAGFSLNWITLRDYTNQSMSYDLVDKTFGDNTVTVALDLVLASDVEYLDQYNPGNRTTASQGDIVVSIDNRSVTIKTDGKTTAQLEQELARELAAKINTTPLIPVIVSKDKRNIKPFDGSEVQLTLVGAEKLTVKVDDPELGVITQFKFKQKEAAAVLPIASGGNDTVLYGLVIAGLAGLGYFFGFRNKKTA